MRESTIIQALQQLNGRQNATEGQLFALTNVLKEIVGKELMRGQALHKVLMDKGLFTDEDLKAALETLVKESQEELKKQADAAQAEKQSKVEILIPADVKLTPEGAVAPSIAIPEATNVPSSTDGQV